MLIIYRELSFGMGRPDTLGADFYHNRQFPVTTYNFHRIASADKDVELLESPHCAILELMVDFSRVIRRIRLELYVADSPATRDVGLALQHADSIEHDLDTWLQNLPSPIKPEPGPVQNTSLKTAREPQYVKKQKLVLSISTCIREMVSVPL